MWKGGSEQQLVTPFPVESSGSGGSGACPKVWFRVRETTLLKEKSLLAYAKQHFFKRELWEVPGEFWEGLGSSGTALRGSINIKI